MNESNIVKLGITGVALVTNGISTLAELPTAKCEEFSQITANGASVARLSHPTKNPIDLFAAPMSLGLRCGMKTSRKNCSKKSFSTTDGATTGALSSSSKKGTLDRTLTDNLRMDALKEDGSPSGRILRSTARVDIDDLSKPPAQVGQTGSCRKSRGNSSQKSFLDDSRKSKRRALKRGSLAHSYQDSRTEKSRKLQEDSSSKQFAHDGKKKVERGDGSSSLTNNVLRSKSIALCDESSHEKVLSSPTGKLSWPEGASSSKSLTSDRTGICLKRSWVEGSGKLAENDQGVIERKTRRVDVPTLTKAELEIQKIVEEGNQRGVKFLADGKTTLRNSMFFPFIFQLAHYKAAKMFWPEMGCLSSIMSPVKLVQVRHLRGWENPSSTRIGAPEKIESFDLVSKEFLLDVSWQNESEETRMTFNLDKGTPIEVLSHTKKCDAMVGRNDNLKCTAVELPLGKKGESENGKLSVYCILPDEGVEGSLNQLCSKLSTEDFTDIERRFGMETKELNITVPSFEASHSDFFGGTILIQVKGKMSLTMPGGNTKEETCSSEGMVLNRPFIIFALHRPYNSEPVIMSLGCIRRPTQPNDESVTHSSTPTSSLSSCSSIPINSLSINDTN